MCGYIYSQRVGVESKEMTEASASPLTLTKLRAPTVRPRVVSRARLVRALTPAVGTSLVLVVAPAGYGKTTLLGEWARWRSQNGGAVAWYAIDAGDDDPLSFGSYLVASLIQALGPLPELTRAAQLLRASPEADLLRILPTVINAVAGNERACTLILDDYHLIGAPAIHSALAFLLERLPECMQIAIGSRSDPPLPLARLRARGRLQEVRTADLRFTSEETTAFLNEVMRLDLSTEGVMALETRTEGWIAGLQLAALSLAGAADRESVIASFGGSHRYLVEYLLEEVVNRQTDEAQSFLLATSILERLSGPLCDALVEAPAASGRRSSQAILEDLERANLFLVPLDDEQCWYRYHHLFREFLLARLHRTRPEDEAGLHRAASAWLAAHGSLREAVRHALQTRDWEYAAGMVEQHSFTMMMHGDIATIYAWCAAFPEEVMRAHPMLCLQQCWALVMGFRRQNRGQIERRLEQMEQAAAAMDDPLQSRELSIQVAVVRTYLAMIPDPAADPHVQLAQAQSTLVYYPEEDAGQFSAVLIIGYAHLALQEAQAAAQALEKARRIALKANLFAGILETSFQLACLAHSQGQPRRAMAICRQGLEDLAGRTPHPDEDLPAIGCLYVAMGRELLEQDHLEEAEQRLLKGLELIGWGMNPYYPMLASLALFRLREVQGRSEEALAYLSRLEEAWPDIAFCTQAMRAAHALRGGAGDLGAQAEAAEWRRAFTPASGDGAILPGMGPFGAAEAYYLASLAWVRVQIALGEAQTALAYLEQQLDLAKMHGLANRTIELSLLAAQVWRAAGDPERSRAALERAVAAGEPEGYLRSFDQGPDLTRLLAEAADLGIGRGYLQRVLTAIGSPTSPEPSGVGPAPRSGAADRAAPGVCPGTGETLSERELEVLRWMARGASNQRIAEELVITVGTVKSHINHILGKLDAHNRTEAVARARGLGWLEI
jgi:LuxR family transcriptional regulator, maltose regulon positive regulatory protein